MPRQLKLFAALVLSFASGCGGCKTTSKSPTDAGPADSGPTGNANFSFIDLDTNAGEPTDPLAVTSTTDGRIGVAYASSRGPNQFDIVYMEVAPDGTVVGRQVVDHVQMAYGISVAFDPQGTPHLAYLGIDPNGGSSSLDGGATATYPDGGAELSRNATWYDNDLAFATVNGGVGGGSATVSVNYAVHNSNEAMCGVNVCDNGTVVGVYPALTYSGNDAVVAYRDLHFGQFPEGDYARSDFEAVEGSPAAWQHEIVILGTDVPGSNYNDSQAGGVGADSVAATSVTGVVGMLTGGDTTGEPGDPVTTLWYTYQDPGSTTWSADQVWEGDDYSAIPAQPSIAADFDGGFGVAWYNQPAAGGKAIHYRHSPDGHHWEQTQLVLSYPVGTLDPAVAFDPQLHLPTIVFYYCGQRADGDNCSADEQALEAIFYTNENGWSSNSELVVDQRGGRQPHLVYMPNEQMVVIYRGLDGSIRMARQKGI
jgi:catechol 2,3-dioxygenase-like lactoylglutathione lyase family enzyme